MSLIKTHFWQGQSIDHSELLKKLESFDSSFESTLVEFFDLDFFIESCNSFSKQLLSDSDIRLRLLASLTVREGLSSVIASEILFSIADFISKKQLKFKVTNELGSLTPFTSRRVNTDGNVFEKWEPLGLVVQVLSGNDSALPVLSAFEGLMSGNVNILKLSHHSSSFPSDFFIEFSNYAQTARWKNRICIVNISSKEKSILDHLYAHADGVVVWGGEEAVNEIRKSVPSSTRFIDWGHKISFSYLTKPEWQKPESIKKLVHDIFVLNQQACSSPQCVYLEDASFEQLQSFSKSMSESMQAVVSEYPANDISDMESAEITKMGLIVKAEKSLHANYTDALEDRGGEWRIWIDSRPSLRASPLYKTIWIKPLKRAELVKTFRPMKQYLQTVGLACDLSELSELSRMLYSCGVTRIRSNGSMQDSYMGEPHDGYMALNRYVRRVSLESKIESLASFSTLNDLNENKIHFSEMPEKIMDKNDFQNIPMQQSSHLYFKSGGSSGTSKISQFTYVDYHTQMSAAANGLMAAGLDPRKDRAMNLFFGGGLYGGFLSFFTILEDLKAVQFPMSAHMDFDFVGKVIREYKVNTLLGMPSYLIQLLEQNKEWLTREKTVEKLFYGGEAFSKAQIAQLKNEYGITVIKSASYGSVDMGPLGYQCPYSDNRTYHLHQDIHHLEILDMESTKSAEMGALGRLVFSTHSREDQSLLRYDVGDLGKWVHEDCPCGRKSPRFELHGRFSDVFRASGSFINYARIVSILSENSNVSSELQIVLSNQGKRESMQLVFPSEVKIDQKAIDNLIQSYPDIYEVVHVEKALDVVYTLVGSEKLIRIGASGKLLHVIDQRSFD